MTATAIQSDKELKTPKAKKTRGRILSAAQEVFNEKGFHKATTQDISKLANLGYGTFYLYFKDKKSVFDALVERVEDDLYTATDGGINLEIDYQLGRDSYRALRKDLRAIFDSFKQHGVILKICKELALTDLEFEEKYKAMRTRLIDRTEQVLRKSSLENVDYHIAAIAISGMIENLANECFIDGDYDFERVIPTITKLYFKAVS